MKSIGFFRESDPGYTQSRNGPVPPPGSGAGKYPVPQDFLETARLHEFRTPPVEHAALLAISVEVGRTLGFRPKP
jgi:hypothetical protein